MAPLEFHDQLVNLERSLGKFAYSLTLEKAEANDLVQETYLKALANQDKFVNHVNIKAWTFTIMKNTFINNYRQSVRRNMHTDRTNESYQFNQSKVMGSDDPDSAYSALEITQIIEKLRDIYRIPFKMLISGYKYQEIADKLNLNIGTVKSRIFISRKLLMDQLNG